MDLLKKIRAAPTPTFTGPALVQLQSGQPEIAWSKVIGQTANHYFGLFPTLGDSSHYREIGQRMYQAYPCIQHEGQNPWVSL